MQKASNSHSGSCLAQALFIIILYEKVISGLGCENATEYLSVKEIVVQVRNGRSDT